MNKKSNCLTTGEVVERLKLSPITITGGRVIEPAWHSPRNRFLFEKEDVFQVRKLIEQIYNCPLGEEKYAVELKYEISSGSCYQVDIPKGCTGIYFVFHQKTNTLLYIGMSLVCIRKRFKAHKKGMGNCYLRYVDIGHLTGRGMRTLVANLESSYIECFLPPLN